MVACPHGFADKEHAGSCEHCCNLGCDGGACESCPCCCAGWCLNGADGVPDGSPENLAFWHELRAEHGITAEVRP